jgi:hypothetical protein
VGHFGIVDVGERRVCLDRDSLERGCCVRDLPGDALSQHERDFFFTGQLIFGNIEHLNFIRDSWMSLKKAHIKVFFRAGR